MNQINRILWTLWFAVSAAVAAPPAGVLDMSHASVRAVQAVQDNVTPTLMSLDGVLGTAIGLDAKDQPALVVYIDQGSPGAAGLARALPTRMDKINVVVEFTDKFVAMRPTSGGTSTSTVSHTAIQAAPIQLGTSGGWRNDLANGYCCGGTLGSMVQAGGIRYILSNYHVFESDIVAGGNGIVATTGSYVIQPGLIDVGCYATSAQNVGTLVKVSSLPDNNVDCSIAQEIPGTISTNGAILEVGPISSQTVGASINKAVKKSGRTTGLTRSKISGLNATISVAYENECAGGSAFTKTFTGQIVISNTNSKFLAGGDSGSLMVEDVTTNPRAIGLLYAGSSMNAIANPIGDVLTFLSAKLGAPTTMVGN